MFESMTGFFSAAFAHKWAALAGGLLVSAPIIIHLINRMRFKRIRWAAMEFLLKAQKKMKRKMVVEQLLLLMLRILLMILVGLLIARFSGFDLAGKDNRATQHLILIDDSPSMADKWKGGPELPEGDGLEQARRVVVEQIVPAVGKAPTAQFLDVMVASKPGEVRPFGQVGTGEGSDSGLNTHLKNLSASTVRTDLSAAIRSAKAQLQKQAGADKAQVLYLVSDMRAGDWAEQGDAAKAELEDLKKAGVVVHLIDVVGEPFRRTDLRTPRGNDNIGIVDLIPNKPVVARGEAVEFILKVKNYGVAPVENARFAIKVNGDDNKGLSKQFSTLPPGQVSQERFELTFDEIGVDPKLLPAPGEVLNMADDKLADLFKRFNLVTASLDVPERGGIPADNVRHAVVEVREKLPVLVVDGALADLRPGDKADGRFVYMKQYFNGGQTGGSAFAVTEIEPKLLDKTDLSKFTVLLLLDVPTLSEAATKSVESFIRNGGGVGVFMGDGVKPADYNKLLYRDGAGFFPVELPTEPTPKPTADQLLALTFKLGQEKFLLRDATARNHGALAALYVNERGLPVKPNEEIVSRSAFVTMKQYFKINRNGKWREDRSVTELFCMPNDEDIATYAAASKELCDKLVTLLDDKDLAKFKKPVSDMAGVILKAQFNDQGLGGIAILYDRLLCDGRSEGDPNEPLFREFWANPKAADLRRDITRFRDRVKFGDPLYLAKTFGRGRVTVMLTSADDAWSDWPSAQPGNACFIPLIKEMVTYLSGGGGTAGVSCGQPIRFDLPPPAKDNPIGYRDEARKAFVTTYPKMGVRNTDAVKVDFADKKSIKLPVDPESKQLVVSHDETDKPGVYLFGLLQVRPTTDGKNEEIVELRAVAANVDPREGDLRRVTTDDMLQYAPGLTVHSPEDATWTDTLQNKKSDLSEVGWLFLLFAVVLVVEQALAVRLTRQGSDEALADTAPSATAALRKATAPTVTSETAV